MDEYISRKAALDALSYGKEMLNLALDDMDVVGTEREKYSWGLGLIESIIEDIKELPSAEIERQWIPCSERLPEEGYYLVWMPWVPPKHMAVAEYRSGYWNIKTPVAAWMPLPEPYKVESEYKE